MGQVFEKEYKKVILDRPLFDLRSVKEYNRLKRGDNLKIELVVTKWYDVEKDKEFTGIKIYKKGD